MVGSRIQSSLGCSIVCPGVGEGKCDFILIFFNAGQGVGKLRRQGYQLYQPLGKLHPVFHELPVRGKDIRFVLCPFLFPADKRSFHVDAHKVRKIRVHMFLHLFREKTCCCPADSVQGFRGHCHRGRADGGHAVFQGKGGNRFYRLHAVVTKIISVASVEMNVRKPRNDITSRSVNDKLVIF